MTDEDVLLITGRQADAALAGRHRRIADVVRAAYQAHSRHQDALPHAGIHARGLERAYAVIMLNSPATGRVAAIMEGSLISAKATAASAALAAAEAHRADGPVTLGLIGCGRVNYEILQFIRALGPEIDAVEVFDPDPARVDRFAEHCAETAPDLKVCIAAGVADTLAASPLVSFATRADEPHVSDLSMCPPGATILHVSLRDIAPGEILLAENLVDDVEQVCAGQTSVHLAEQQAGHRDFIRASLGDVLLGRVTPRTGSGPLVFSPAGLRALDVAVAGLVLETVQDAVAVPDFWPTPWNAE